MVVGLLGAVAGLVKARIAHTDIDTHAFRLHYRWTAAFCFVACALVAASDFIGDPIMCLDSTGVASKPITTYCWISSTFTINSTIADKRGYYSNVGSDYHGIGQYDPTKHSKTYHSYYQWVPFVLFFQGCLFYLPHLLWKANEGKLADSLLQGLNQYAIDGDVTAKKQNIVKYLKASRGQNWRYSVVYFICEGINFANVLGQMFLLDLFFGGIFMDFGTKVINFAIDDAEGRHDPLATTFPRISMCTFHEYGPSGTLKNTEALCILPQNILNEKVFIIMWFWFALLAAITAANLAFRVGLMVSPDIRVWYLMRRGRLTSGTANVEPAVRELEAGDFFLLDILMRNLDALAFRDVLVASLKAPGHTSTYKTFASLDDDDDPISLKRNMEKDTGV